MGKVLKNENVGFPDLEAAFEAVKGLLFGPLDAHVVKHKFNEIVREKKQERDLLSNPLSPLAHARDDRENRDRRDRDFSRLAVMALLNGAQQQRLGAIYDGIDGSRGKGAEIGKRLSELEDKLKRWQEQIMAKAARDPVTGKAIFQFEDGRVIDEDGNDVPAERVAGVDFTGKTRGEEKAAYDAARSEVNELKEGLGNALGDLDTLEQDLNRRIMENPDKADEFMDEVEAKKPGIDKRLEDLDQRVSELEQRSDLASHLAPADAAPISIGTIGKLELPSAGR